MFYIGAVIIGLLLCLGIFNSRLFLHGLRGYLRFGLAVVVVITEAFTRMIFSFVPRPISATLDIFRERLFIHGKRLFRGGIEDPVEDPVFDSDTLALINLHGYVGEERVVKTSDGYLLTLHRIVGRKGHAAKPDRPPVLMVHGLLMCSECWVVTSNSLGFALSDAGYDVWLANCRGNRYSTRHERLKPQTVEFWDFSLDELALYDIPACVDFVLNVTQQPKVAYVGFSQGTALGFACFSTLPSIADKVSIFVALAPACKAKGFQDGALKTFVRIAPDSVFLMFGRKRMFPSVLFWRHLLSRKAFATSIDLACKYLFGWNMEMYGSQARKEMLFAHLYSATSVKVIVHWMQISAKGRFEMYDEMFTADSKYTPIVTQKYPIGQIRVPMAVFYGDKDTLTDMAWVMETIPKGSFVYKEPAFQHMEMIWAGNAPQIIFPKVIEVLNAKCFNKKPDHRHSIV